MSGVKKDTIQKILLIALAAMTVSMVLISVFNYKDNKQKSDYLKNEKELVHEELTDIIKNYDHLIKKNITDTSVLNSEKKKVKELLKKVDETVLDYESIIKYRKQLLILRKTNRQLQQQLDGGMQSGRLNSTYYK
jgi:hypothetical protein